jgi:hypothetical protein
MQPGLRVQRLNKQIAWLVTLVSMPISYTARITVPPVSVTRRRDDEWPTLRADKSTVRSLIDVIWKTTH